MGLGVAWGIAMASQNDSPLMSLKGCLAWWTFLSLIFSVIAHCALALTSYLMVSDDIGLRDGVLVLDRPAGSGRRREKS